MLHFLIHHKDEIGAVAVFSGLAASLYSRFVSPDTQQRNHEALTRVIEWATNSDWRSAMQGVVRQFLRLLTFVYGPLGEGSSNEIGRYLTTRAWKMSAWIASIYVFVLAPVIILLLEVLEQFSKKRIDVSEAQVIFFLTILIGISTWLHWNTLGSVRRNSGTLSAPRSIEHAVNSVSKAALFSVLFLIAIFLTIKCTHSGEFRNLPWPLRASFLLIAVGALVFALLYDISTFGFYAIPVFLVQMTLCVLLAQPVLIFPVELFALHEQSMHSGIIFTRVSWAILFCWLVISFSTMCVLLNTFRSLRPIYVYVSISLVIFSTCVGMYLSSTGVHILGFGASSRVVKLMLAQPGVWIITIYGAIFANSIPDWLSVGLTRTILDNALIAKSLRIFGLWVLIDILAASIFLFMSTAIIFIAIGVAFLITNWVITSDHTIELTQSQIRFVSAGYGIWHFPVSVLHEGITKAAADFRTSYIAAPSGYYFAFFVPVVSCTALIPTALNALMLGGLAFAKTSGEILVPVLRALHGVLVVAPSAGAEERARVYTRSAAIFGFLGVCAAIAVLWVIDGFPTDLG